MTPLAHILGGLAVVGSLAACSSETDPPVTPVAPVANAGEPAGEASTAPPAAMMPSAAEVGRANRALLDATLDSPITAVRQALADGADVSASDPDGRTGLMLAAYNGRTNVVGLLLERGAQVADRDSVGRTALMYSSTGAFADTVELLLSSDADPNATDEGESWTPLMFAAGEGQTEVVRTLLSYGADPGLVDGDGDTALDHALTKGHNEVAQALRKATGGAR